MIPINTNSSNEEVLKFLQELVEKYVPEYIHKKLLIERLNYFNEEIYKLDNISKEKTK